MTLKQHISNRSRWPLPAAACLVLCLAFPVRGFAQCEADGAALGAASAASGTQVGYINTLVTDVEAGWHAGLDILRASLGKMGRTIVLNRMDWFWVHWGHAWQRETAQLSSGIMDQSRQIGSINDASNTLAASLTEQKERVKSQLLYQPTDQACRFDTTAPSMTASRQISRALENGFEWDFVQNGNNERSSHSAFGKANLQNQMWTRYRRSFCDYRAENGHAGCDASDHVPYPNLDTLPSQMLFSQDTIDMSRPIQQQALNQMMFNVTGYAVPDPMMSGALGSVPAVEQLHVRRKYLAQMAAVGALIYSVAAERASGLPAPDVYNLRHDHMGVAGASPNPSQREIRQSIIEQLWDPNYYKDLYDNPSTVAQKEVYLKAYSLMMLNDMISKQEKISNVYAIETANILDDFRGDLAGASFSTPVAQ